MHSTFSDTVMNSLKLDKSHLLLGYLGLIPFIGLALAQHSVGAPFSGWLLSYASLIFSFLGGVIWLASLAQDAPRHGSWVAIIAMLWAWLWLIFNPVYALVLAGSSFLVLHAYERLYLSHIYPLRFMQLRLNLSLVASCSLLSAALI